MGKQIAAVLESRDQGVFAKLTKADWKRYAGKVLAIDPRTDEILAVGVSESEIDAQHKFKCPVVEYFHVPNAGQLKKPSRS